jgi:hypothetical protein
MAELKRKEEQLSTADLAGRGDNLKPELVEDPSRPRPVQRAIGEVRKDATEARDDMRRDEDAPRAQGNIPQASDTRPSPGNPTPLFSESDVTDLRGRWGNVQASFVDEPRKAVQEADNLVASVMKRLAEGFAKERSALEQQWDSGDNVSTEDLRVALQRYRSFFDRLLNA